MAPLLAPSAPAITISAKHCTENKSASSLNVPSRHSVHFEERVRVRKTIHLNEFSDDEIDACWYSDQEFNSMRAEVRFAADLIDQGLLETDNTNYCRRGAEEHAPLQSRLRRKIKHALRAAVLEEQRLQWGEGSCDPEFIAEVSQFKSAQSIATARKVALEDELAAML